MRSGCHNELQQLPVRHTPVAKGRCVACHAFDASDVPVPTYHEGTGVRALVSASGGRSCASCHQPLPPFHVDPSQGDEDPCLRCHDPHGGTTQAALLGPERTGCATCHTGFARPANDTRSFEHGPLTEDRCTPCHPAHAVGDKALLRGSLPAGPYTTPYEHSAFSACYGTCHSRELVETQPTTQTTRFRNGEDNLHYRHVVASDGRGRSCGLCHEPHRSSGPALMRKNMPFGQETLTLHFSATPGGGNCTTSCHIPAEYDRERAIPSRMRILKRPSEAIAQ
ncbi:MAG: hypothetical protein GY725_12680 [bacterium]|nr:hypothetical protein [bacterium]